MLKDVEYLSYNDILNITTKLLKDKIFSSKHKFLGNPDKIKPTTTTIQKYLRDNNYKKVRLQINGERKYYYYKLKNN